MEYLENKRQWNKRNEKKNSPVKQWVTTPERRKAEEKIKFKSEKKNSSILEDTKQQIDKDKVFDISPFSFKGEIIPSIHVNPVRFLGRTIDFTVSDKHSVAKFVTEVLSCLKLIDKSSHKGIHKVWILQNMLIPRLRWLLLIYEISSQLLIA